MGKKPTNIRQFRHAIATLKRKGLVDPAVDARSVRPAAKYTKLLNRFDDVLSGKATPVKLAKSETKNMKDAGYDVFKGRTIFPHSAGEKVGVSHGHAKVRQPNGVERVTIPVQYHDLPQYLKKLKKNDRAIDNMKRRDEYFAFRFYGHQSHAVYRNIDLLLEDLQRYDAIEDAKNSKRAKDMNEVYRNLEIVKVHRARDWKEQGERIRKERGEYNPTLYKKQKRERKKNPAKDAAFKAKKAALAREYRASLTGPELEKYKAKARKRSKKSRRKNGKKKGGTKRK